MAEPHLLLRHLSDVVVAEVCFDLEIPELPVSRLETQTVLAEIVIETFEPFVISRTPIVGAPFS